MSWPTDDEVAIIFNIGGMGDRWRAACEAARKDMARMFGKGWNKIVRTKKTKSRRNGWYRV
jgi:hypothetical protein